MIYVLRVIVTAVLHIIFDLKITGKENVPKGGGYLVACNHQSYWDPVFICLAVPPRYSFMAKVELFRNKAFAWLISTLGAFPVTRGAGDNRAIELAIEKLEKKRALIIFPEGTRNKKLDGKVLRGKSGISVIVSQTGANVVPIAIWYGKRRWIRKRVTVCVGELIKAEDLAMDENNRQDLRRVSNLIMGRISALLEQAYARG